MNICCVVPTIRPKSYKEFRKAWDKVFDEYKIKLLTVWDGDKPKLEVDGKWFTVKDVMGKHENLIFNKNDGVRNLGFAYIAKYLPEVDIIMSLDDDVLPQKSSVEGHLIALEGRFPLKWISTASIYTRGFPYGIRDEAECVFSHGVWDGVPDLDAPTQLVSPINDLTFYKGAIPQGIYAPICGMNIAFKRKLLPYVYYAPMGPRVGMDRFADIWMGINVKRVCDKKGWAMVTGYSHVTHNRASNVWKNLQKEVKGLELNETYWLGDEKGVYFKMYAEKREQWKQLIEKQS